MRTVQSTLAILFSLVCGLPSCGGQAEPNDGAQKANSWAIWGGAADSNTAGANAVVHISGCTGTLITPRLVLTAAHCLNAGSLPTVDIGNSRSGFGGANEVQGVKALPYPGYHKGEDNVSHPYTLDAQLVWLARPVEQVEIVRPSLTAPANPDVGAIGMAGWSTCGPTTKGTIADTTIRQAVIWRDGVYQSASGPVPLNLTLQSEADGTAWKRDGVDVGVCFGDSGGPLFMQRDDGKREVFGVLSLMWLQGDEQQISAAAWTDITQGPVAAWIKENALDRTAGGHTPEWLAFHGKSPDTYWFGETDYTGACDTTRDPDCDYWYSEHDDQPNSYNPAQGAALLTPCAGLCQNPTEFTARYYSSGWLGTGEACFETTESLAGMVCNNIESPREFRINGKTVSCGGGLTLSEPRNNGYCLQTTAGAPEWASFQTW